MNVSYVESLERKVQELEASSKTPKTHSPASAPSPYQLQSGRPYAPLSLRNEDQHRVEQGSATQYGPISTSPYESDPATNNHQNSSRARAREGEASRPRYLTTDDESPSEGLPENEIRDVNSYTKVRTDNKVLNHPYLYTSAEP